MHCSGMSVGSSSSKDNSSSDTPDSSHFSVVTEGGSRCYSYLGDGLGIWLLLGVVPVEGPLTKRALLALPCNDMVALVLGEFQAGARYS
jgi:hypothetical protein